MCFSFRQKEDDVLDGGLFQLEARRGQIPAYQRPDAAVGCGRLCGNGLRPQGFRLLRRVVEDAVALQQGVLFLTEQQLALMEKGK